MPFFNAGGFMAIRPLFSFFTAFCITAAGALGAMANAYQPQIKDAFTLPDPAKMAVKAAPGWASSLPELMKGKTP